MSNAMNTKDLVYFNEEVRRATFIQWPFDEKFSCNVNKMAEAGFIFVGSSSDPDAVKCFFCDKELSGWEDTDDPWKEHLSHSPRCEFALMQKPIKKWTIEQYIKIMFSYKRKLLKAKFKAIEELEVNNLKLLKKTFK